MAAIIAYTAVNLTKEQKQVLCAEVERGAAKAFGLDESKISFMLNPCLPPENYSSSVSGQMMFFVYTAPGKTDDQKREMVHSLYESAVSAAGKFEKGKICVIIKEHADCNVGLDGVLKIDM